MTMEKNCICYLLFFYKYLFYLLFITMLNKLFFYFFITPLKNPSRRDGGTKPEALVPKVNSTTGGQATAVSKGLPFTDFLQS